MSDPVDHAAEALRHLASGTTDDATIHALLDIAAAIRENPASPRCLRLVPEGWKDEAKQCIRNREHAPPHESENGVTWH